MEDLRIVSVYESQEYIKDTDFEDEESKDDYYCSDFFTDSDYISVDGSNEIHYNFVRVGNEIITQEYINEPEVEEAILRFYGDDFKKYYTELQAGNDFKKEDDPKYVKGRPILWYRGNSGYYYYYCHQYYKNIEL